MIRKFGEGLAALLLLFPVFAGADTLLVSHEDGRPIVRAPMDEGEGWCVLWHHSVKGFEVTDCYENRGGRMVLVQSHLPDFAAGLDHIPGRGRQVSDGQGGYYILDINEPVPGNAYVLRPGRGWVDHRIEVVGETVSLSAVAAHERVTIALLDEEWYE